MVGFVRWKLVRGSEHICIVFRNDNFTPTCNVIERWLTWVKRRADLFYAQLTVGLPRVRFLTDHPEFRRRVRLKMSLITGQTCTSIPPFLAQYCHQLKTMDELRFYFFHNLATSGNCVDGNIDVVWLRIVMESVTSANLSGLWKSRSTYFITAVSRYLIGLCIVNSVKSSGRIHRLPKWKYDQSDEKVHANTVQCGPWETAYMHWRMSAFTRCIYRQVSIPWSPRAVSIHILQLHSAEEQSALIPSQFLFSVQSRARVLRYSSQSNAEHTHVRY